MHKTALIFAATCLMGSLLFGEGRPGYGPHKMRQGGIDGCRAAMARIEEKKAEMAALEKRLK